MPKPKVIIAETETDILFPLQQKFAESFFEQIDLEIISDPDYFKKMISESVKADILMVSEALYDASLRRHNFPFLFLLTEKNEEGQTVELDVIQFYKYTSVQQIFQEVMAKAGRTLTFDPNLSRETQIVLVTSAGGGDGKTTVAMGLSAALARNYRRVLYINAAQLQTFQRVLENTSPITETEVYAKLSHIGTTGYDAVKHLIRTEKFSYLPSFKAALISLGLNYSIFGKIAEEAKFSGDYDYIVLDMDEEFDKEKIRMLDLADKVVIVTRQTMSSAFATDLLISNINGVNSEKYVFICNDYDKSRNNYLNHSAEKLSFSVNEYIEHISNCDSYGPQDFFRDNRFQKLMFLID